MSPQASPSQRTQEGRRVLTEGWAIALLGVAFALVANAISPRGLSLMRNYFPPAVPAEEEPITSTQGIATEPDNAEHAGIERIRRRGFQVVGLDEAHTMFQDPGYQEERIVFIDARKDQAYQEGHIPGAYQFDHYYPERYLPDVLPAAQLADSVVIYCTGGECEDSEFAAVILRDAGIPRERIHVFAGGMTVWAQQQLPIEVGARLSGVLTNEADPAQP